MQLIIHLNLGSNYLKNILKTPTSDLTELRERQRICKAMLSEKKTFTEITSVLEGLARHEKGILWALKSKTNEERRIIESVYFQNRFLKQFNFNENFMTFYNYFKIMFAPFYGILSPVIYEEASDDKNRINFATSSGYPNLFIDGGKSII